MPRSLMVLTALVLMSLTLGASPPAVAQDKYPSHAVRIIVPFSPGAATDLLGRLVAAELGKRLGQPFVIQNTDGAGGAIGIEQMIHSKPDGYTLAIGSPGPITVTPVAGRNLPYNAAKDIESITLIAAGPAVFVVRKSSLYLSVAQVITAARSKPDTLTFGSAGVGASSHLNGELFKAMAHVGVTHIPYRGSGPAATALLGGQIDFMIQYYPAVQSLIKSGSLRALAISSPQRYPISPEIPTMIEAGVPGYESATWIGLHAPAGTPKPIIDLLQREVSAALHEPSVTALLRNNFAVLPGGNTPADFEAYLNHERAMIKTLVTTTGLTVD